MEHSEQKEARGTGSATSTVVVDRVRVILNPRGGYLTGQAKLAALEQALQRTGLRYQLDSARSPAHAGELARQAAAEGYPVVVAAGGDGIINHILNGLMEAAGDGEAGILGIVPLGTANDLADMLGLPRNLAAACRRIAAGRTRLIDVGQVNSRYFVNNSAVGMEPVVTLAQDRMRRVRGRLRYLLAALKSIATAQSWLMRLRWGNSQYEGPVTLVSVGNSRRTGGSFYMTPQAVVDDGLLDFVYAVGMSRWQMLRLLPLTLTGKHIHHPLVVYLRATSLSLTFNPPTPIQADGEIIDPAGTEIFYRIIPHKLRVIV